MTYMFTYVWPLGSRHTWRTINVHSPIRFRNSRPKPDQGDNLFTLLWAQSHGETAIRRRNLTTPSGYSLTAENGVAATGTRGAAGAAAGGPVSQSDNGYEKKKTRCHRPLGESPLAQPRRYVTFTDTFACLEGTISGFLVFAVLLTLCCLSLFYHVAFCRIVFPRLSAKRVCAKQSFIVRVLNFTFTPLKGRNMILIVFKEWCSLPNGKGKRPFALCLWGLSQSKATFSRTELGNCHLNKISTVFTARQDLHKKWRRRRKTSGKIRKWRKFMWRGSALFSSKLFSSAVSWSPGLRQCVYTFWMCLFSTNKRICQIAQVIQYNHRNLEWRMAEIWKASLPT